MVLYKLQLKEIREVSENTKAYIFPKPEDFSWEEGAHIHIGLEGFDSGETNDKTLVRHMSLSSLPEEEEVVFTTRVPGSHSLFKIRLESLKAGDYVTLFKCGSRMGLRRENRPLVLLSMGVGIATMRPVIKAYAKDSSGIQSLTSLNINGSTSYIYRDELDVLQGDHLKTLWTTDRNQFSEQLLEYCALEGARYYVVGSDGFLLDVIKVLHDQGIARENIQLDKKEEKQIPFFEIYVS